MHKIAYHAKRKEKTRLYYKNVIEGCVYLYNKYIEKTLFSRPLW